MKDVLIHLDSYALLLVIAGLLFGTTRWRDIVRGDQDKWLLPAAILGIAGLTLFFAREWGVSKLVLALDFSIGIVLSIASRSFAISFFVATLFLRPWEVMEPNAVMAAMPRFLAGLCFGTWLVHELREHRPGLAWNASVALFMVFAFWLLITAWSGPHPADAQAAYFETFAKAVGVFLLVINLAKGSRGVQALSTGTVLALLGLGGVSVYRSVSGLSEWGDRLESIGLAANPNDIAALMVMALPFSWELGSRGGLGNVGKIAMVLYWITAGGVLWLSGSRGAMLAFVVMLGLAAVLRTRRTMMKLGIAASCAALFFGGAALFGRVPQEMAISSESRINYWKSAISMVARHPVLGVGFNEFPTQYERFAPNLAYEWGLRTVHSSWFLVLAEGGIVGAILFGLFYFSVLRSAWMVRQTRPAYIYAVIGYSVAMTFLSHTYLIYPYILFGLVIAARSTKDELARAI